MNCLIYTKANYDMFRKNVCIYPTPPSRAGGDSESDTMFNERDRKCAAVQLMLSTDPSYDNMTITSTLKM